MGSVLVPNIGNEFAEAIDDELHRAAKHQQEFSSLHEAWAVIAEEVDELWEIVKMKRKVRDPEQIRKELIQVAAMAIKALHSLHNFTGGSV